MDLVDKVNLVIKKKTSPARQQFARDVFVNASHPRVTLNVDFLNRL